MTIDEIVLDGRESALLVAALFILDCWAFEADDARVMIDGLDRGATDKVATEIAARWRHSLEAHQLWDSPTRIWTQELIDRRKRLAVGLTLRLEELPLSILALRSSASEFASKWWEFCVAAPGAMQQYGVTIQDLVTLADRLRRYAPCT